MKKNVFSLLVFVLLVFGGCSKEEKEEPKFSLKGKIYAGYAYSGGGFSVGGIYFENYDAYSVIRFISDNEVEETTRKNSPQGAIIGDIDKGTYILSYPLLTIKLEDRENAIEYTFIDENTFRIDVGGKIREFTKQ